MRIDAVMSYNHTQNNNKNLNSKNVNFGEMTFSDDTFRIMNENLNLSETDAMAETAQDVLDLKGLISPYIDVAGLKGDYGEYVLLNGFPENKNIMLSYEPFVDKRYATSNPPDPFGGGNQEIKTLYHYGLGGEFKILNTFVPLMPDYAQRSFDLKVEGDVPIKVDFLDDNGDASKFRVYAANDGNVELAQNELSHYGFMPNEACPVPTKNFVRYLIASVYNYLIDVNVKNLTPKGTEQLRSDLQRLRKYYNRNQLQKFLH